MNLTWHGWETPLSSVNLLDPNNFAQSIILSYAPIYRRRLVHAVPALPFPELQWITTTLF